MAPAARKAPAKPKKPAAEPAPAPDTAPASKKAKKGVAEGGGLLKFFGGGQPPKEEIKATTEEPAQASPAPVTGLQKLFAAQQTKAAGAAASPPAQQAQPEAGAKAAEEPAPAIPAALPSLAAEAGAASATSHTQAAPLPNMSEATTSPVNGTRPEASSPNRSEATSASAGTRGLQLSDEQRARIEENRKRARERQQANRDGGGSKAEEQQTPSPLRPASTRSMPLSERVTTPEKVGPPHQERRQSPMPVVAAEVSAARVSRRKSGFGGRFAGADCGAWMQFNNLYSIRLKQLRQAVLEEARGLWGGMLGPEAFLPDISGYRKNGTGCEVVIIGVIFKELKGRPNIIELYKDVNVFGSIGEGSAAETVERLSTDKDTLWLEDGSMRLRLAVTPQVVGSLPTGLIVGVRGASSGNGDNLQVSAICFPRMASPPPLPVLPAAGGCSGPFLALVSGLAFGAEAENEGGLSDLRGRLVNYLMDQDGSGETIKRLIICGGTFVSGLTGAASKAMLQEADEVLAQLASAIQVEVMPGRGDPTNLSLPQMPLHPHLFKRMRECKEFRSVTNPYECNVDGLSVLGHSGQPVEDILRCTDLNEPLEALATCLKGAHLAPTAPDTLPTQPFVTGDPFILEDMPHVLFSGGHEHEGHQWHPSARGTGGTLCVCVPSFRKKPVLLLVNLCNPQDVRTKCFSTGSADGGKEEDTKMADVHV